MPGLQSLGDNVYLFKGSPNTGIIVDRELGRVVVVDPGIGEGRGRALIEMASSKFNTRDIVVVLTHGHTDHLAALSEMGTLRPPVYGPRHCLPLIESSVTRRAVVYGGFVSAKTASMPMIEVTVDYTYSDGNPLPGFLTAVSLPGHSPGHSGLANDDVGVFFAGDAILGERVIERFGIPFGLNLREMLSSIKILEEYVEKGYTIIPGHGPLVSGERAAQLLEANRSAIVRVREKVLELLEGGQRTLEELTVLLTKTLSKANITPRQILLNRTAVQSVLAWLEEEGLVEPTVTGTGVSWKAKKH